MYISELELHGFKSFANKTRVKFDSGLTAIVGPNGCGKSNIVDALRWVLGEQRPSQLRSANMTNVIFNGTSTKKPLGLAGVSLTFVNNRGVLPTEYNEVTITRRLFRSGESEYMINHTPCRLKDIMELFMDTGMGANAYSVIELKMVEEILNDKNNDRRHLFEEAAGVTKYKDQRKKTLRKLEDTRQNVQRMEDLLVELRKKARSLKTQAERAKRAKNYEEQVTVLDQAISYKTYQKQLKDLKPIQEKLKEADQERKELQEKLDKYEEETEQARNELQETEQQQNEIQRRSNQAERNIQQFESDLRVTREKIRSEKQAIQQHEKELEDIANDLEELRNIKEDNKGKIASLSEKQEKARESLEEVQERYNALTKNVQQKKQERGELNRERENLRSSIQKLKDRKLRLESKITNREEEAERLEHELKKAQNNIEDQKRQHNELSKQVEEAEQAVAGKKEKLNHARSDQEQKRELLNEIRDELRSLKSEEDSLTSEKEMLRSIARSQETFPTGVKYVLEYHEDDFPGIKVLSDGFSTDPEWSVALERVLDDAAYYLVVQNQEQATEILNLLKENDQGQAGILPLNHWDEINLPGPEKDSLYHKVECEEAWEPLKRLLLGNVLVSDDLESARNLAESRNYEFTVVTRGGDVIGRYGIYRGGSKGKHLGVRTGLQARMNDFEEQLEQNRQKQEEAQQRFKDTQADIEAIDLSHYENELEEARTAKQNLVQQQHSIGSNLKIYEKNLASQDSRLSDIDKELDQLEDELEEISPDIRRQQERLDELDQQAKENGRELNKLEDQQSTARDQFNQARLDHNDVSHKLENLENEQKRAASGITRYERRREELTNQLSSSRQQIQELEQSIGETEKAKAEAEEKKKEVDKELNELEETAMEQRGNINRLEKMLKDIRRQRDVNQNLLHQLDTTKNQLEMESRRTKDHIWEQYGLMMDQIAREFEEENLTLDDAQEKLGKLRQKLQNIGQVNPLAIEEYEEEQERLSFYEEQLDDLYEAEEDLKTTIEEINTEAERRFNDTFQKIKDNFQTVFHTLFEEDDECDLLIEQNPDDPLDAKIEIIANPRGKRPTNINQLSGGEKTLTAIALLFAIYLVKPSPFCVLDEVDAPLDDANIERFISMLKEFSEQTQFIIITHNKKTMSNTEMMYGVTMQESGVSQLVGVRLEDVVN